MSRKLVSLIQDIKGLPGKYKRVLQAWASFANNDGTNIFASKETVGARAGVSRWTVYENTEALEAVGVLQRTSSHSCKTEKCNKSGTHFTSQHGQYTAVYKINVAVLENPTVLIEKLTDPTVVKPRKVTVGKSRKGTVVKPDATQAVNPTPATAGQNETLPLVPSEAKKKDSETAVAPLPDDAAPSWQVEIDQIVDSFQNDLARTTTAASLPIDQPEEQDQKQPQPLPQTVDEFWQGNLDMEAKEVVYTIKPNMTDALVQREVPLVVKALQFIPADMDAMDLLRWNHAHKRGALYIRSAGAFLNAVSTGELTLLNDYDNHEFDKCKICLDNGIVHTRTMRRALAEERERKAQQQRAHEAALAAAERKKERDARWAQYDFTQQPSAESKTLFRQHRKFELDAAMRFWHERHTPLSVLNSVILYLTNTGVHFGREDFDSSMEDAFAAWKHANPHMQFNETTGQWHQNYQSASAGMDGGL